MEPSRLFLMHFAFRSHQVLLTFVIPDETLESRCSKKVFVPLLTKPCFCVILLYTTG